VYAVVNLGDIGKLDDVDTITPETLIERGIVKNPKNGIKILGDGEITRPLIIKADAFSASALAKISAAGGKAEVI
jgi:large subunit ribosomal protein L15